MFHMLSCINLKPDITIGEFDDAVAAMTAYLKSEDLLHDTGPIGRRARHPVMDTDDERDHEFFFVMSFADRAQCDRAVAHVYRHEAPGEAIHQAVFNAVMDDAVFICWEDLAPGAGGTR